MASGRLADYIGVGPIASRPAAPNLYAGTLGLWFATDTGVLSAWDGTSWEDIVSVDSIVAAQPSGGWSDGSLLIYSAALGAFVEIPPGVPGQVLTQQSGQVADWEDQVGGGGAVDSVNGQTGVVVLSLFDLSDVLPNTGTPEDGDVLAWSATQNAWIASPASGAVSSVNGQTGAVTLSLEDLDDVMTGTGAPDIGDTLVWDGSQWVAQPQSGVTSVAGFSGAVTRANLQGTGLGADDVGFRNIPQNSQSAAYTTVAADAGKHLLHPSADTTARTFTIDSNANVAYPVGTAITFVNQNGAGVMTIAITSDTMRLAGAGTIGSRTLAANGVATALKVAATEWIISGTGLT